MRRLASLVRGIMAIALAGIVALACAGAAGPASHAPPGRPAPGQQGDDGGELSGGGEEPLLQPQPPASPGVLIIYTGSLTLEVTDLRGTIDQATAVVAGLGGHVAASHEENSPGHEGATVTYRIPAARWSEALAGLRGLGQRVLSEDTDSQDVTAQVVDLDARIENLRASEAALQGIMARATTITDVLKVQDELTAVRAEIESMTAQRDNLADRAAMATLDVVFSVPVMAASVATGGWDLGREVDNAVASLVRIGQGLASLAVWLVIVVLPVAIPVVLAFYVAARIRRRYLARSVQQPIAPTT